MRWNSQSPTTRFSPDVYRGFGFPGADDLGNMFQFKAETESAYCGARDLAFCHVLNPELQTFARWLSRNKSRYRSGSKVSLVRIQKAFRQRS